MTLTASIVADRRTLLQWLFDPIFAVREPSSPNRERLRVRRISGRNLLFSVAALTAFVLVLLFAPTRSMAGAVEAFGFSDVKVSGFAWLSCGEGDVFRRRWTGRRADGRRIEGVVCGGLAKGWTVRITSGA